MADKGRKVTIKGVIYEENDSSSDIYESKPKKKVKFDKVADSIGSEVTSQATQSGVQAVIQSIQTQASSLGASGLIAVGSAGAFQVEHIHDHSNHVIEKATPMIQELLETGTIKDTIPEGHSKYGQDIPKVDSVLGIKVGEARKQAIEEKNKTDEEKAIEEQFRKSVQPPNPNNTDSDGSVTSISERSRSMT
tara:strand:+ start:3565 stop:4140 length:576 start_codon:yes stop_codon:yes gene_type:complete